MTNSTGREVASDQAVFATKAALATPNDSADLAKRGHLKAITLLRKRAECRVEEDLDAFWENVPI